VYDGGGERGDFMGRVVVWERIDTVGVELAEVELSPVRVEGEVVVIENGEPMAVSYQVDCDGGATTLRATVRLKRRGARQHCHLERSAGGGWTVNGNPAPQLEGLADVDLSVTPSTNTAPLRRLRLAIGQEAEVTAAWVKFPTLDVVPLRQIYRRVGPHAYEYEAPELQFATEIECDEEGVVRTYGGLWRQSL
jgi:hypothetical protein